VTSLDGRRIVVPESRELDLFVSMLERQGAAALRCPLVTIYDLADPRPVEAWLRRLAAGAFDDVILFTGEGLRRMMKVAEAASIVAPVVEALAPARKIVRGPKPTRVLRSLGLAPDLSAEEPTTAGLIALLDTLPIEGRRIGLQLYPDQSDEMSRYLAGRGAVVDAVLPYRYASHEEDRRVADVIRAMAAGGVDLIAFTSTPQVRRLVQAAEAEGLREVLDGAMGRTRIAAIGPVTADAVRAAGWQVSVMPGENFHLKPMIAEIAALFARECDTPAVHS
jgi:uroporphyrinogen-III synthase